MTATGPGGPGDSLGAPSPAPLIALPDYRRLWLAGALDNAVRWLDLLAVGVFTYQVTGSALWVSFLLFVRVVPMLFLGAFIGALAESISRRRLLVASNIVLGLTYGGIALSAWLDTLALWQLGCGCFLSGVTWAMDMPARRTIVAEVVGLKRIGRAMAIESSTYNLTRIIGPAGGGILFETLGMYGVYTAAAALAFTSALTAGRLVAGKRPLAVANARGLVENLAEGIHYITRDRTIVAIMFVTVIINMLGASYVAMVPVIGQGELNLSPFLVGVLMSSEGCGAFLGALLLSIVAVSGYYRRIFLVGSFVFLSGILGFAIVGTFGLALVSLFACGVGLSGFGSMQSALVLSLTAPPMRNRVMGVLSVCVGTMPIGVLLVGILAYVSGPRAAVLLTSSTGLLCLLFAVFAWPELRRHGSS